MIIPKLETARGGTWIISPHSDDAALSLGYAIYTHIFPMPIRIVTVFSVSDFSAIDYMETKCITQVRRLEDAKFANWVGVDLVQLHFEDAPLRNDRPNKGSVFESSEPVSPILTTLVSNAVQDLNENWAESLLVLPFGIGGHIDHRTVSLIGENIPARMKIAYADQPYALEHPHLRPDRVDMRPLWTATMNPLTAKIKTASARHYSSQPAAHRFIRAIGNCRPEETLEVLWPL